MNLPPGAHAAAAAMLIDPYGTTRTISVGGKTYLARVEPHYDKGQTGVDHWHKGVSVFEPVRASA